MNQDAVAEKYADLYGRLSELTKKEAETEERVARLVEMYERKVGGLEEEIERRKRTVNMDEFVAYNMLREEKDRLEEEVKDLREENTEVQERVAELEDELRARKPY